MRPSENSIFFYQKSKRNTLLTRFRLSLSHLRDLQDTLNPICNCFEDIETLCHYLLHGSLYTNEKLAFLNVIQGIDNSILELTDSHKVEVLLYDENSQMFQVTLIY